MKSVARNRRFAVVALFFFMLLHQTDRLLIGPLTTPIMQTFGIDEAQMGAVFTGALVAGALLYPVWGYLYDRFARARLLALASLIWGATTWLSAIAPTYPAFLVSRASTGIDDSSYPGVYSLVADYFGPAVRGRVYGILQLTMPFGYLLGMALALGLGGVVGWRNIFLGTGLLGVVLSGLIALFVREPARGSSEPELAGLAEAGVYRFDRRAALQVFRKRSLRLLLVQGFFGVFPWEVITAWSFRYLETERNYPPGEVFAVMGLAVAVLAAGYFAGGAIGDFAFKRTLRGRVIAGAGAVLAGAALVTLALNVPLDQPGLFVALLCATAFFVPFASPNVVATVYDMALPEVRSTAMAVQSFVESIGAAAAPLVAGVIAAGSTLKDAILVTCVCAWVACGVLFLLAAASVSQDIRSSRAQLRQRAGR